MTGSPTVRSAAAAKEASSADSPRAGDVERGRVSSDARREVGAASGDTDAKPGTYVVREGDCLWHIAARHLGEGASDQVIAREVTRLWKLNAKRIGTGNPDLIYPGQTLAL